MLENITFVHPYWLGIGFLMALICIFLFVWGRKKYNFVGISDLQKIYKSSSYWYYVFIFLVVFISIVFGILFAQPLGVSESKKIKKNGIDIQVIFDVSYSMIAQDIRPSRIEVAKTVVSDFVSELEADRVGLILFSGKPFTSIPLSFDYDFIQGFLSNVSVDTINQDSPQLSGTAIGDALVLGAKGLLKEDENREKIIILLTDGEANRGIDPLVALAYLKEKGIKTYTIGVGKDDETFIELVNAIGIVQKIQIGGIDETTLKKISSETGGKYYRADSKESLANIFKDISQLEKTEIEVEQYLLYTSKTTHILLVLILLTLGVGYFLFYKRIEF